MLLLDTCALIWFANGERMSSESINAIEEAALGNGVFVSPVSAWEIGLQDNGGGGGLPKLRVHVATSRNCARA